MELNKYILVVFTFFGSISIAISQQNDATLISNKEIKLIKKENKTTETYHFQKLQYVKISSSIWRESKVEKKQVIKNIFPKVFKFIENNSSFEASLLLDSYKKNNHTIETLINSNSSGLKRPKLLSLALQSEYSDYRSRVIKITGGRYYNPIYYPNKYIITNTQIKGENESISIYSFTPKKSNKFLLKGNFQTNIISNNILYFNASPSKRSVNIESDIIFENKLIDDKSIPVYSKTETKLKSKNKKINGLEFISETHHLNTQKSSENLHTSNISLDLDSKQANHPLFDSLHAISNSDSNSISADMNNALEYFEALRFGRLGLGKFDILLKHIFSYNNVEGMRFGIGLATNKKLSKHFDLGGYFAGGNRDKTFKYGGFGNLIFHKRTDTKLSINYIYDLLEPGQVYFPFSKRLFLNEGFRKYAITKMDRVSRFDSKIKTTIWKNIFVEGGFINRNHLSLYDYKFSDDSDHFNSNELTIGIRYNPVEKFFKMNDRLYSLGSKYPSLFINYTKSIKLENYTYYAYDRIDVKVEKNIHLMEYGIVDFQLIGGHINTNDLPYPLAYNMQGSFRPGTPVINNTFGTMGYNEFVATQYLALFYQHNIGKIAKQKNFQPELLLLHNIGYGNKLDLTQHKLIKINTMEKGFFESGFYLKNLISLQNIIGQTGFGAGFVYRYGSYQYAQPIDNLVFKFSLDIDI